MSLTSSVEGMSFGSIETISLPSSGLAIESLYESCGKPAITGVYTLSEYWNVLSFDVSPVRRICGFWTVFLVDAVQKLRDVGGVEVFWRPEFCFQLPFKNIESRLRNASVFKLVFVEDVF